jgi:hypothetical protein
MSYLPFVSRSYYILLRATAHPCHPRWGDSPGEASMTLTQHEYPYPPVLSHHFPGPNNRDPTAPSAHVCLAHCIHLGRSDPGLACSRITDPGSRIPHPASGIPAGLSWRCSAHGRFGPRGIFPCLCFQPDEQFGRPKSAPSAGRAVPRIPAGMAGSPKAPATPTRDLRSTAPDSSIRVIPS